jgi:hypothetical protein
MYFGKPKKYEYISEKIQLQTIFCIGKYSVGSSVYLQGRQVNRRTCFPEAAAGTLFLLKMCQIHYFFNTKISTL